MKLSRYTGCLVFWLLWTNFTHAAGQPTIIRAGKLIDVENGVVRTNQLIFIGDGKITAIKPASTILPQNVKIIDLSHSTVLPGLIDSHTHLVGDTHDADPLTELSKTAAERAFESIPNARNTLMAGFTTVRDLASYRALIDVALRDAINRGEVIGPRMYVAGAYITITGGGGSVRGIAPDVTLPWDLRFGVANGVEQVRERVRELEEYNVDLIKVIGTGAVLSHGSIPGTRDFTFDEIQVAVQEANKKGLRVAAHAHGTEGIKDAIRAGAASIEHGSMLDDEAIQLMKEHGTFLVADIYDHECIMAFSNMPADFKATEIKVGEAQRDNFRKAVKAGVNIAFGTDACICPHGMNAKQFYYQVIYGQSPMQAIQSATINAATLLGKQNEIGSLKVGKRADIIAVKNNPINNVRSLEQVSFVMKDGIVYKNIN